MRAVPECLVDNMAHFITYLRYYTCSHQCMQKSYWCCHRHSESDVLSNKPHLLSHLITFATVFMGWAALHTCCVLVGVMILNSTAISPSLPFLPPASLSLLPFFLSHTPLLSSGAPSTSRTLIYEPTLLSLYPSCSLKKMHQKVVWYRLWVLWTLQLYTRDLTLHISTVIVL